MDTKKILDFIEVVEDCEIINLKDEEVKKLIDDETLNIYNIFGSLYHTKLQKSAVLDENHFSDGTKLNNRFSEGKVEHTCLYCARDHEHDCCPNVICKKCGNRGHSHLKCINTFCIKKSTLCKKCTFTSHSEFDCPAVYRKYKIVKDIPNKLKSCGNCAGDHFTNDCPSSLENSKFSVFSEKFINYIKSLQGKK